MSTPELPEEWSTSPLLIKEKHPSTALKHPQDSHPIILHKVRTTTHSLPSPLTGKVYPVQTTSAVRNSEVRIFSLIWIRWVLHIRYLVLFIIVLIHRRGVLSILLRAIRLFSIVLIVRDIIQLRWVLVIVRGLAVIEYTVLLVLDIQWIISILLIWIRRRVPRVLNTQQPVLSLSRIVPAVRIWGQDNILKYKVQYLLPII